MVAIPNMNWMGNEPSGSAYDVYQYYLGGGNPNATPGGGGGGGTTGIMQAFPTGGDGPGQGLNQNDFWESINKRQTNIKELHRPLEKAQFPSFPQAQTPGGFDANKMYNEAAAAKARGEPYQGFTGARNPNEVMDYANEALLSHQEKARTGQFGPSYIPAEKPTFKRKISDAFYSIPGINKPYSIEQLMKHGATQQVGGPGILGFLGGKMDKYHTLPRADQAFISSMMGYTGGDKSGLHKDPYGINVRSGFGNYADYTNKAVDKLGATLTKSAAKRGLTFDPKTGKVTGGDEDEIADWQKQTKLLNEKFGFYTKGKKKISNYRSDVNLIDKARKESIKQAQGRVDKDENKINKAAAKKDSKSGASTVNPNSAYGKKQGYTGGHANPHTNTGWSGSSKSSSSKSSGGGKDYGPHSKAEGGMITDLTKAPEYRGWKKMYESNPEVGSMHDKHPTFIKFYKQHERDKKKFGGLAGLLYG